MSKLKDVYFSLIVFSIYSGIMGAVLLIAPKIILPLFKVHEAINSWTYMLGFVLLCSSFYYLMSGLNQSRAFAWLTVFTRLTAPIVAVMLYLSGNATVHFLLFSFIDATGGIWTLYCLKTIRF
jgi:hypothetical protein